MEATWDKPCSSVQGGEGLESGDDEAKEGDTQKKKLVPFMEALTLLYGGGRTYTYNSVWLNEFSTERGLLIQLRDLLYNPTSLEFHIVVLYIVIICC